MNSSKQRTQSLLQVWLQTAACIEIRLTPLWAKECYHEDCHDHYGSANSGHLQEELKPSCYCPADEWLFGKWEIRRAVHPKSHQSNSDARRHAVVGMAFIAYMRDSQDRKFLCNQEVRMIYNLTWSIEQHLKSAKDARDPCILRVYRITCSCGNEALFKHPHHWT